MKKQVAKLTVFILIFLSVQLNTFSQNKGLVGQGDRKYSQFMYMDAATIYQQAIKRKSNDEVIKKIALCYVKLNDPLKVAEWYGKVNDKNAMTPEHHYNYAQALSSIGKFEEAKQWYKLYEKEASKDLRGKNKVYALEHLEDYYKDSSKYEVAPLSILNSQYSDFAPSFFKDGIVFPSGRFIKVGSRRTFKWDNSAFLDLYYSEKNGASPTDYKEPIHFSSTLNTKYHEGACTFSKDGNKIIFTRNNYFHSNRKRSSEGSTLLKLYYSEHSEGKDGVHGWHHFTELPFNSDEYSVGDPCADADFHTLYFVSNMPGGQGGTDIYKSTFKDGKWSKPENLGSQINTPGNERFPFLHSDGTLFFSSDGRDGIGGLDIYEAKLEDKKWEIHDMGYPINSPMDDFGLILSDNRTYGYFSSNRFGGVGSDDIYKFLMKNITLKLKGNVFVKVDGEPDKTKQKLPGANVIIYDKTHKKFLDTLVSDANGEFNVDLIKGAVYEFRGEKDALIPGLETLDLLAFDEKKSDTVELLLIEPLPDVIRMVVEVREKDTEKLLPNSTVYLMDAKTGLVSAYVTDESGKVTLSLKPETDYVMKGTKIKYLSDCVTFNSGKPTKDLKKPERALYLDQFKVSQKFKIENVFFDLDKHNIRPDAAVELDKVVAFILEHPGITVELGSHTDSRGSDAYNLELSDKRAKSSREYIVSKGVAPDAITYKGYGETQLTNRCANDVKCNDLEHQQNRRTEIKITGIKDLSPEEEAILEKNKQGLTPKDDLKDCNPVQLKTVK
jgi:outer membrane protein OmpA-like peptidoglycan-associated protein/tetratricopeptide (TPR) repeat protein